MRTRATPDQARPGETHVPGAACARFMGDRQMCIARRDGHDIGKPAPSSNTVLEPANSSTPAPFDKTFSAKFRRIRKVEIFTPNPMQPRFKLDPAQFSVWGRASRQIVEFQTVLTT